LIAVSYDLPVPPPTFESFSQNGEDVVLWRALHQVANGRYIDVGANDPEIYSVSMGFYNRGWSGITVEPDPAFAQMQRAKRPRDLMVEAAITAEDRDAIPFHVVDGTGLSTVDPDIARSHARAGYETHDVEVTTRTMDSILEEAGWRGSDIHFMSVDTEGSERDVLESINFGIWRPWILIVEATAPLSTEPTRKMWEELILDAGYCFCLFDGVSCYYVAEERTASLGEALGYPACAHDDYSTREYREAARERLELAEQVQELAEQVQGIPELVEQVTRWRAQAVNRWATAIATRTELEAVRAQLEDLHVTIQELNDAINEERFELHKVIAGLRTQIDELHESSSWKVTRPLRIMGGLASRPGPGRG
jgi:FkbM family methyltransferase